jgi:glycerol-3-phosphate dehydrogenase
LVYKTGMTDASSSPIAVTVLGAGSWGTALALHAARRGHPTRLWTRSVEHFEAMRASGSTVATWRSSRSRTTCRSTVIWRRRSTGPSW